VNFQLSNSTFTTNSPDATLDPGETLTIQLQFNKSFVIEGGSPRLLLNNGEYATLSAQSGSTMTFTYTPTAGSPQVSPLTFGADAYDANGSRLNPGNERPVSEPGNISDLNNYDPPGIGGVTCFLPGTLISTPSGDRAIEDLAIGDDILTASGRAAPIRWIGRQTVSLRFTSPDRALPIRIRAGALGDGLPARDLLVSPAHAILVDGILANAGALVNGTTIRREDDVPRIFTYYNIELAEHDLLLAEGVPAETFVDNVSRNTFDNGAEHTALYGDVTIPEMDLPRATAHRQIPAATRQRLAAIAAAMDDGTAAAA
jgi:hypothetical protein